MTYGIPVAVGRFKRSKISGKLIRIAATGCKKARTIKKPREPNRQRMVPAGGGDCCNRKIQIGSGWFVIHDQSPKPGSGGLTVAPGIGPGGRTEDEYIPPVKSVVLDIPPINGRTHSSPEWVYRAAKLIRQRRPRILKTDDPAEERRLRKKLDIRLRKNWRRSRQEHVK